MKRLRRKIVRVLKYLNRPRFIMPVLIIAYGVAFVRGDKARVRLMTHHSITDGIFNDFTTGGRSGSLVHYSFEINGKTYTATDICNGVKSNKGYFLTEHHFPVVYQIGDTDNNEMLITPDDFKAFHIEFPDSLSWVKTYLNYY